MTTQPSKEAILKACEEAGVPRFWPDAAGSDVARDVLKALARRIEAEREAVPVEECPSCHGLNLSCPHGCGRDPETGELDGSIYAVPPKEPTT